MHVSKQLDLRHRRVPFNDFLWHMFGRAHCLQFGLRYALSCESERRNEWLALLLQTNALHVFDCVRCLMRILLIRVLIVGAERDYARPSKAAAGAHGHRERGQRRLVGGFLPARWPEHVLHFLAEGAASTSTCVRLAD